MKVLILLMVSSLVFSHELPFSQPIDFFPAKEGNVWVYSANLQGGSENYFFVQLQKKDNGLFIENYFGSNENFEISKKGNEIFFSTEKEKFLIYEFEKGAIWHIPETISINTPCIADSYLGIADSGFVLSTPAGIFNDCIRVLWDNPCKDAGIIEEVFAPNVGLVKRVESRIFGLLSFELIYASVNGVIYGSPSISISAGISPEYIFFENSINIEIKNNTPKDLNLTFATSQLFDLILENEDGKVLYKWSSGQSFLPVLTNKNILPFDEINFSILISFPSLEKGFYYLKIIIPVSQINTIPVKNPFSVMIPIYKF